MLLLSSILVQGGALLRVIYFHSSMILHNLCYGAALLLATPWESTAQPTTPPDSTVTPRRHLLTLHTLHIAEPFIPALGYERRVWTRWGVRASLGGESYYYRYNYDEFDVNGIPYRVSGHSRSTTLFTDVSLNYYLQARKPTLVGWFVGGGVITAFNRWRTKRDGPNPSSRTSHYFEMRPILRGGRHWALGQRWLLDTNVAVAISSYKAQPLAIKEFIGVGAGYRF